MMSAVIAFDPTKAQRRWLLDLLHGFVPRDLSHSDNNFGGTRAALMRRGLIDRLDRLTPEGRILAKQLRDNPQTGRPERHIRWERKAS